MPKSSSITIRTFCIYLDYAFNLQLSLLKSYNSSENLAGVGGKSWPCLSCTDCRTHAVIGSSIEKTGGWSFGVDEAEKVHLSLRSHLSTWAHGEKLPRFTMWLPTRFPLIFESQSDRFYFHLQEASIYLNIAPSNTYTVNPLIFSIRASTCQ